MYIYLFLFFERNLHLNIIFNLLTLCYSIQKLYFYFTYLHYSRHWNYYLLTFIDKSENFEKMLRVSLGKKFYKLLYGLLIFE